MKNKLRFIKNLVALALISFLVFLVVRFFQSSSKSKEWEIEDTPMHVESIKTIAEISVVSYKDEVVVDSIEYYKDVSEKLSGNIQKIADLDQWKYGIAASNIKRRLTLIVKGEVRYGMDLSNGNYKVSQNDDTIWFNLPKPKILDVIVSPSSTEVFQENGYWSDNARIQLENMAKNKLRLNAENLKLYTKTEENIRDLFEKIIYTDKKIIIYFE